MECCVVSWNQKASQNIFEDSHNSTFLLLDKVNSYSMHTLQCVWLLYYGFQSKVS